MLDTSQVVWVDGLSFDAVTNTRFCYQSWDTNDIWSQEGLDFSRFRDVAFKNTNLIYKKVSYNATIVKIPHISHHIWFTNHFFPREMSLKDQETTLYKVWKLNLEDGDWKHVLWVSNKNVIPDTVRFAEQNNILVREITDFVDFSYSFRFHVLINQLLSKNEFGQATDIWRVIVTKRMGGFYSDNDYTMFTSIDYLTKIYDAFFGFDDHHERYTGNAIIATSPEHPVLNNAFEILVRNSFHDLRPDYVKYPCSSFAKTITTTGPTVLSLSAHRAMNQDGYTDVIFPHGFVFYLNKSCGGVPSCLNNRFFPRGDDACLNNVEEDTSFVHSIGNDAYSGSWMTEEAFAPLPGVQNPLAYDNL